MNKPDVMVLSTSLNQGSKSRILARAAFEYISAKQPADWVDLQDYPLPLCDGGKAYGDANVVELSGRISQSKCILVGTPIYNYDVNAALKNLIELTGASWKEKTVGFICAAGGKSSYMSVMGVANSLMLDFRAIVIPRFVYADGEAFENGTIVPKMASRLDELCDEAVRLCSLLYPAVTA